MEGLCASGFDLARKEADSNYFIQWHSCMEAHELQLSENGCILGHKEKLMEV